MGNVCLEGRCVRQTLPEAISGDANLDDANLDDANPDDANPDDANPGDANPDDANPGDANPDAPENRGIETPGEVPDSPVKKRLPHLYYVQGDVWEYRIISVCWLNPDPSHANERMWVRSAVEHSWERYTNVRFVGWTACTSRSEGIKISVGNMPPSVNGGYGKSLNNKEIGLFLDFRSDVIGKRHCATGESFEHCVRLIARRVFGQLLGLRYGFRVPGSQPDPKLSQCTQSSAQSNWVPFRQWDAASVMNQCNPHFDTLGSGMSRSDIVGIQMLYGLRWEHVESGDLTNIKGLFGIGNWLYYISRDKLQRMNALTGIREHLGSNIWDDTAAMTEHKGFLYIVQKGALWKFDPSQQTRTQLGKSDYLQVTAIAGSGEKLYMIQGGQLHQLDLKTLQKSKSNSTDVWPNAKLMVADASALYIHLESTIWRVDLATGARKSAAFGNWTDTTAMVLHNGSLFVQANTRLYKVELKTTLYTKLSEDWKGWEDVGGLAVIGDVLFIQDKSIIWRYDLIAILGTVLGQNYRWKNTTAVGASDTHVYVVDGPSLWRIKGNDGLSIPVGSPQQATQWKGATIISYDATGGMLYIKQGGRIWKTHPTDGTRSALPGAWENVSAMAAFRGSLFVVDDGVLKRIALSTNAVSSINRKWFGTSMMVATEKVLYLLQQGEIKLVEPTTGVVSMVSPSQLYGTSRFVLFGRVLYVQNGADLWRWDPGSGDVHKIGPDTHFKTTKGMAVMGGYLYIQTHHVLSKAPIQ